MGDGFVYELRSKLVRRQSELLREVREREAELEAVGAALRELEAERRTLPAGTIVEIWSKGKRIG